MHNTQLIISDANILIKVLKSSIKTVMLNNLVFKRKTTNHIFLLVNFTFNQLLIPSPKLE